MAVKFPKMPRSIGGRIDLVYKLRAERLELKHDVDDYSKKESEIKEGLLKEFGRKKLTGSQGSIAKLTFEKKDHPSVKDRKKFIAWCTKNGHEAMMQVSVNEKAWREFTEATKRKVPGVEVFTDNRFSLTKLPQKGGK